MYRILLECAHEDNCEPKDMRVMWGDAGLLDDCYYSVNPQYRTEQHPDPPHPLDRWQRVLDALNKRGDLFDAGLIGVHVSGRLRDVRSFKLIASSPVRAGKFMNRVDESCRRMERIRARPSTA